MNQSQLIREAPRPMRAMNLIKSLLSNQHEVTLWTSRFYHQQKEFRETGGSKTIVDGNFTTHLIDSPGYSSNMGFARLYDHWVLAKNLGRSLAKNNDLPDVVFVGYPPIEIAKVMIDYCNRNRIPVLLDVKDLWPEILLKEYYHLQAYRAADFLSLLSYCSLRLFQELQVFLQCPNNS